MAKPGQDAAEQMARLRARGAGGAVDLAGRVPIEGAAAEKIRREAEGQLGMRCGGCHERIGVGLQFTRIDVVRDGEGRPTVDVMKLAACNGAGGCDYAEKCRGGADVIEMIEFVWLAGDAPVGAGSDEADVQAAERAVRDAD